MTNAVNVLSKIRILKWYLQMQSYTLMMFWYMPKVLKLVKTYNSKQLMSKKVYTIIAMAENDSGAVQCSARVRGRRSSSYFLITCQCRHREVQVKLIVNFDCEWLYQYSTSHTKGSLSCNCINFKGYYSCCWDLLLQIESLFFLIKRCRIKLGHIVLIDI